MNKFTNMKKLRRALSALAAVFTLSAQFCPSAGADTLDGETMRAFRALTGGAGYSEYVLGAASSYGVQEFSAVTFDCTRDDLRFDVLGADSGADVPGSFADTVCAFRRTEARRVVAALSVAPHPGDGTAGVSAYTAYGGAMICSGDDGDGVPDGARACSFGVAADGRALVGEIDVTIEVHNRRSGQTLLSGALNCFPESEAFALYTESGALSPARGEYILAVDVAPGYSLTPAVPIEGTVVGMLGADGAIGADITPGDADAVSGGAPSRMFIAFRGDSALSGFEAGDRITLSVDISDASGRTALWRTVACAVGGVALVRDGERMPVADQLPGSAAVIGLRPDGSAVMLASYGAQKGYSLGFTPGELADVCLTLGMTDAVLLSTDENVLMLCEGDDAALVPTGKSKACAPSGAIVLSVPDNHSALLAGALSDGADDGADPAEYDGVAEYKDHSPAVLAAKSAGYSAALADGTDLLQRMIAAAPEDAPRCGTPAARPSPIADGAADTAERSICSLYRQLEFEATGEWLTLVIKESDLDAWYGKIFDSVL